MMHDKNDITRNTRLGVIFEIVPHGKLALLLHTSINNIFFIVMFLVCLIVI